MRTWMFAIILLVLSGCQTTQTNISLEYSPPVAYGSGKIAVSVTR